MLILMHVIKCIGRVHQHLLRTLCLGRKLAEGDLDLINDRLMTVLNHSTNVGMKCRRLWIRKAKKKFVKFRGNLCW